MDWFMNQTCLRSTPTWKRKKSSRFTLVYTHAALLLMLSIRSYSKDPIKMSLFQDLIYMNTSPKDIWLILLQ